MITIKSNEDILVLREGGRRLAGLVARLATLVHPGLLVSRLDVEARRFTSRLGDEPSFLSYRPAGAKRPYPAALCVSVNDEVVHGIPNERERRLKDGDICGLDMGLKHGGLFVDMAVTVPVGAPDEKGRRLIAATRAALEAGIAAARGGGALGDVGAAIQKTAKLAGFSVVEELAGHGLGYRVHEEPYVPNVGQRGHGEILRPGMVIAIEPMLNEGGREIILDPDGYTVRTRDGTRSAHFEHTLLITDGAPEILTKV